MQLLANVVLPVPLSPISRTGTRNRTRLLSCSIASLSALLLTLAEFHVWSCAEVALKSGIKRNNNMGVPVALADLFGTRSGDQVRRAPLPDNWLHVSSRRIKPVT